MTNFHLHHSVSYHKTAHVFRNLIIYHYEEQTQVYSYSLYGILTNYNITESVLSWKKLFYFNINIIII